MKKYLSILAILIVISPSVALASWWNPISWFNNWKFTKQEDKTEILENRVKELEKKLELTTTTNDKTYEAVITEQKTKSAEINKKLSGTTTPKTYERVIADSKAKAVEIKNKIETQVSSTTQNIPKTYTLPNGAIIDIFGNIIKESPQQKEVSAPTVVVIPSQTSPVVTYNQTPTPTPNPSVTPTLTPSSTPSPSPTQEVVRQISFDEYNDTQYISNTVVPMFQFNVSYSENGSKLTNIPITITVDKEIIVTGATRITTWTKNTGPMLVSSFPTRKYENKVEFYFVPVDTMTPQDFNVTVSANGVSSSKIFKLVYLN